MFAGGGVLSVRALPTNAAVWRIANARDSIAAASPEGRYVARGAAEREGNRGPYVGTGIEAIAFAQSGRATPGGIAGEPVLWTI